MRVAILLIALAISACGSESGPAGVDPSSYSGMYVLARVNGQAVPVTVATASLDGDVTRGDMSIDWDTNYWLSLTLFAAGVGSSTYLARGNAIGTGVGEVSFYDRDLNVQWVGTRTDTSMIITDLGGIQAEFRWVGPYRRPG